MGVYLKSLIFFWSDLSDQVFLGVQSKCWGPAYLCSRKKSEYPLGVIVSLCLSHSKIDRRRYMYHRFEPHRSGGLAMGLADPSTKTMKVVACTIHCCALYGRSWSQLSSRNRKVAKMI